MATADHKNVQGTPATAIAVAAASASKSSRRNPASASKQVERIPFEPTSKLFSPTAALIWMLGLLAVGACIAPWFSHGWLFFDLVAAMVACVAAYDALTLWLSRQQFAPVLLMPEKGLRGGESQSLQIPLALTSPGSHRGRVGVRAAIMPPTAESDTAFRIVTEPQWLNLSTPAQLAQRSASHLQLWPWSPEISLLRRGLWPVPRVGVERQSGLGFWRLRQWFDSPEQIRIEPDLRHGRREILRSPIYRALVAARQTPWTGHGRDFERLREYQPGDMYSEIAWKSTARRAKPVTRLFQWEQKQEVYFLLDQSRSSAFPIDPSVSPDDQSSPSKLPRRMLDLSIETALVGATVALELGDEFGLVTYADEPKSWLRAGSGQAHFQQFRDRLLQTEPLPTTADYEALFSELRVRLRRRAYLVLLADLTERSVSESLRHGLNLVRSSHAVLMTSILPAHAQPAFSPGENVQSDDDVYAALAAEKENQRLGALSRQLRQLDVHLRFVSADTFLRAAVEGYLESKREQRL
jgi:uncharacterized protein (DUF58 family)